MRRPLSLFILTLFVLTVGLSGAIAAPVAERSAAEPGVSLVDSRGVTVSLDAVPRRIVSLSPNITETLFALGVGDRMVGRTDYCDYPPQTSGIPSMGDLFSPSIEKIVSLQPDLVIISTLGQSQTIEAIESTGIPVALIDEPGTMEGTYLLIETVGAATGTDAAAKALTTAMRTRIAAVSESVASLAAPTVYYVAGFGEWGDFTATGDTFIHDLITLAGGENIAKDAVNWSYQLELLISNDPDIIILPPLWGSTFEQTKHEFITHPSYRKLSAVQNNRIVTIDSNLVERQGPRSAQAVETLADLFHPER